MRASVLSKWAHLLLLSGGATVRPASSFALAPSNSVRLVHRSVPPRARAGCQPVTATVAVASLPEADAEGVAEARAHAVQKQLRSWSPSSHLGRRGAALSLMALMLSTTIAVSPALADEYGRETEAPTLFTGENVLICKKRGPLGACLKTEVRTAENDNDKASTYMKSQDGEVGRKDAAMRAAAVEEEGAPSELLTRLRQQTEDNRERNERLVMQKTIENNQAASFGPFDRQTVILNADGNGYTLLENPQAMRLKKAGYIKDRQFVTQPTAEVMNEALEPSPEESSGFFGGVIKGVFGGGGGD